MSDWPVKIPTHLHCRRRVYRRIVAKGLCLGFGLEHEPKSEPADRRRFLPELSLPRRSCTLYLQ